MRPYLTNITTTRHNLTLLCSWGRKGIFLSTYNFKNNLNDSNKDDIRDNINNSFKESIKNNVKNVIKKNVKNKIKFITKTTSIHWVVTLT